MFVQHSSYGQMERCVEWVEVVLVIMCATVCLLGLFASFLYMLYVDMYGDR